MPDLQNIQLNDLERATIFLLSLPEELAMPIFQKLTPEEIKRVNVQIQKMEKIESEHFLQVYEDFEKLAKGEVMSLRGGDQYLRKLVEMARGEDALEELFGEEVVKEEEPPKSALERISDLEPSIVANILVDESPQTIAVILSQTEASFAAATMEQFPHHLQIEVLKRMSVIENIPKRAFEDIERVLSKELDYIGDMEALELDGITIAADVIKHLDFEIGDELLKELEEVNEDAVSKIRRAMFTFEDLRGVDTRGFQTLLKEITNDQLIMALKGASDELRDKILGSLSKRAAAMILDDLEILPPQRLSVVEQAQQEIVEIAMKLESEGKIQVAGHGGEQFV